MIQINTLVNQFLIYTALEFSYRSLKFVEDNLDFICAILDCRLFDLFTFCLSHSACAGCWTVLSQPGHTALSQFRFVFIQTCFIFLQFNLICDLTDLCKCDQSYQSNLFDLLLLGKGFNEGETRNLVIFVVNTRNTLVS